MKKGGNKMKAENPDRLNRLVAGTKLIGDLSTNSNLRVDGEIIGNVNCVGKFVLGAEGVVSGDVTAVEVELDGLVQGQIFAESILILHKTAIVRGDIRTKRLVIEDGAQIDGNIQTGDLPPKPTSSPNAKIKEEKLDLVY